MQPLAVCSRLRGQQNPDLGAYEKTAKTPTQAVSRLGRGELIRLGAILWGDPKLVVAAKRLPQRVADSARRGDASTDGEHLAETELLLRCLQQALLHGKCLNLSGRIAVLHALEAAHGARKSACEQGRDEEACLI